MATPHGSTARLASSRRLQPIVPKPFPGKADGSHMSILRCPAAPKNTRASKPKVRTGCITCKIRRVKCDEARPICQRCAKARLVCDGYGNATSSQLGAVADAKAGVRDGNTPASLSGIVRRSALPYSHIGCAPTSKLFRTNEVPYFDFFRHELTDDFSGYHCTDFWTRVVLCEAMTNDCIRYAVLAIAALSQGISNSLASNPTRGKPSALFPWTSKAIVNNNHQVALRHYVQAVHIFQKHCFSSHLSFYKETWRW
ncbi:hypothetical protein BX600DRAFT_473129 [Xylariales sp. PMI_506]|nr:hypothetical protein BX600DRAFT_473129 [Xylariales sp. PMI_506]